MQDGKVVGEASIFKNRASLPTPEHILGEVIPMRAVGFENEYRIVPTDEALERVGIIASSMYDELSFAGYERESDFLMTLCLNLVDSGATDAEISHTAFEFIKNFPEVTEAIITLAHEQSRSIKKVGATAIKKSLS